MSKVICLHGPESVGKSVLAEALAEHFPAQAVPEYGRDYCAEHGTDLGMSDLLHIAQTQTALIAAARQNADWVVTDTDALMTGVWADMMLGARDPWFDRFSDYADLYLLLDIDLPFVDDGLRLYGGAVERRRFFALCKAELERRGVPYALIGGTGADRLENALAAIRAAFGA
ncbi:MAG: AAA family ATPase [Sphingobium sp.]|nr:AAA family ATPase [Sphingobium sp.]